MRGDKHTLWERLKKAEAALRARQAKARDYVERERTPASVRASCSDA